MYSWVIATASKGSSPPDQNQTRACGASRSARASKSPTTTDGLQNNTFTQQYLKQLDEAGCFDDLEVANVFLVNSVAAVSLVWQPCADDGENRFNFLLKTIWYSPQHYPPLSRGTHFVSEGDTRDIVATSLSVAVWLDVTRLSADVKTNPSLICRIEMEFIPDIGRSPYNYKTKS
uniref:SFRICE_035685 n=1 Tax=Spodoptera frugiperda TaxID=7108 RepID=A0A2H1W0J8_SPOFR